jgi:hypothetical protein
MGKVGLWEVIYSECSPPLGMRPKHDDCHYMFNAVSEKMVGMAMTSQKTISEIPESQLASERLAYVVVV